jgi:hypothetical protein
MESTEPDVVIMGETPNKQLKSQVTYDYRTPTQLIVMLWSGETTAENESMNFHKYCVSPKNLLNSVIFVETGHFMMASIFVRSILSSPPPIRYPKYTNNC